MLPATATSCSSGTAPTPASSTRPTPPATGSVTRLSTEPADSPSIALDAAGHVHIAFNSGSFDPGIVSFDDTSGAWVRARVTAAHLDGATSIVVTPDGEPKIAFARYAPEAPGIYVASAAAPGEPWVLERLTSAYDDDPSIAVRTSGEVDVAFVRFQSTGRGLYYAAGTSTWDITPLVVADDRSFDRPSLAIGSDGRASDRLRASATRTAIRSACPWHASSAAPRGSRTTRSRPRVSPTTGPRSPSTPPTGSRSRSRSSTRVRTRASTSATRSSTTSSHDRRWTATSRSARSPTSRVIAFKHVSADGDRGIRYGKPTNGTWTFENASTDPSAPSVVVDDAWHARIFTGDAELSNATGTWIPSTLGLTGHDLRASRDPDGHAWVAFQTGVDTPSIASDRSGGWQTASNYFGYPGSGAVAVGVDGRIHWAIAGDTLTYESSDALDGPWSQKTLGEHATDPSILVDETGSVHILWRRTTSDEGTYYTTNASGSWATTRLTRTSAEGAPALALDGTGHIYVAVVRGFWAASPGLYLITNRTGRWVTSRIDGAFDDMDPQLAVDAGGRATIVLGRYGSGIRAYGEPDVSGAAVDPRTSRIREVDIGDARARAAGSARPGRGPSVAPGTSSPPTVPRDHTTELTP